MSDTKSIPVCWIARHGTTELNQENCFRGPLNPNLDQQGFRDAEELAKFFRDKELGYIFYSPKKRSATTAAIVNVARGLPMQPAEALFALDVGTLGGQKKTAETEKIVQFHVENPDVPFPGGESLNQFRQRVRPALQDATDFAQEIGKPVLLVAHSSIIHEAGEMINGDHATALVKPGGVAAIQFDGRTHTTKPIFKPDFAGMREKRHTIIT